MIPMDFRAAYFEIRPNLSEEPRIDDKTMEQCDFRSGSLIKHAHAGALSVALGDFDVSSAPSAFIGRRIIIASDRLVSILTTFGIYNLQLFPALVHCGSSKRFLQGYQVVNVIGLVDAAEPESSTGEVLFENDGGIDIVDYANLVISRSRALDMDLFVLASNPEKLIVSGRVMGALLEYTPEEGWGFIAEELETR